MGWRRWGITIIIVVPVARHCSSTHLRLVVGRGGKWGVVEESAGLRFYGNFRCRTTVEKNLCIKCASCTDLSDRILDLTDLCKTQICAHLGNWFWPTSRFFRPLYVCVKHRSVFYTEYVFQVMVIVFRLWKVYVWFYITYLIRAAGLFFKTSLVGKQVP